MFVFPFAFEKLLVIVPNIIIYHKVYKTFFNFWQGINCIRNPTCGIIIVCRKGSDILEWTKRMLESRMLYIPDAFQPFTNISASSSDVIWLYISSCYLACKSLSVLRRKWILSTSSIFFPSDGSLAVCFEYCSESNFLRHILQNLLALRSNGTNIWSYYSELAQVECCVAVAKK